ncbi:8138_t:CDS:2 [Ambispora leptoticha]|uniref:8138_t:CDS:1 n=1 Tax=Ambispora leptoticha TaxID=144679 RepID=A0A9N9N3J7_9GLOM|nr:8138_t:CDS:2 [Ambispora leptoticha]
MESELKTENGDSLVALIRTIVKVMKKEIVKNLGTILGKKPKRRPRLCYECRRKGHLARSCPSLRNQDLRLMEMHRVDVGEMNCDFFERDLRCRKEKVRDNERAMKALVRIKGEHAEMAIRISSCTNKMSVKYAKRLGFTWKCLDNRISDRMGDEFVGYIPDVDVAVCGVSVNQPFYVVRELTSDIVLGMPWVARSRCNIQCKDGQCRYTIESGSKKATFEVTDEPTKGVKVESEHQIMDNIVDIRSYYKERKKDTKLNGEVRDVEIFRCVEVEGKRFVGDVESDEPSKANSDHRAETDNKGVNGKGRSLNNNCHDPLRKQWMKRHMMFMNNRIRDPAWLRNPEHRLINMYGVTTIVNQKVNWSHAVSYNGEKIEFLKRLYLDHMIGCDGVVNATFGSRLTIRKLGGMMLGINDLL